VPYEKLSGRLLKGGQVLHASTSEASAEPAKGIAPSSLPGVVVDDSKAILKGAWIQSAALTPFVGNGYQHDQNRRDGKSTATYEARLPRSGRYAVRLAYTPNGNRSSKVRIVVRHAGGEKSVMLSQKATPPMDSLWAPVGTFDFQTDLPARVTVTNDGSDGYVVVDAVQWLPAN
jgi:hypothetical protein